MVNEQMGNQSANMRAPQMKLVVAFEDFIIRETPTDIAGAVDDVPSGLVREVRLGRKSSTHQEDTSSSKFMAYDVIGGLKGRFCNTGSGSVSESSSESAPPDFASKVQCDVFYVLFNPESKRWEVLEGGGGVELSHGLIIEQCNSACSTYRVQRVHRYLKPVCDVDDTSDSMSDSASASDDV
jgi:hypothetical protein